MAAAAGTHFGSVGIEDTGIVSLAVNGKEFLHLGIHGIAVVCTGLLSHTDTAVGHHGALKGLVSLETDDFFLILVQIAGAVGGNGGNYLGIHIQDAACLTLLAGQIHNLIPQIQSILSRACQEGFVTIIHGKIVADEASQVNFIDPAALAESAPACIGVLIFHKANLLV